MEKDKGEYIPKFLLQKALTDQEISLVKNTFKGNDALLKVIRKLLWPDFEWDAPLGQTRMGFWVGLDQMMQMTPMDREVVVLTQIRLNNAIEKALITLSYFAELPEEKSEEEKEETRKKDSTK